jgi:hypothetical protein
VICYYSIIWYYSTLCDKLRLNSKFCIAEYQYGEWLTKSDPWFARMYQMSHVLKFDGKWFDTLNRWHEYGHHIKIPSKCTQWPVVYITSTFFYIEEDVAPIQTTRIQNHRVLLYMLIQGYKLTLFHLSWTTIICLGKSNNVCSLSLGKVANFDQPWAHSGHKLQFP